MLHILRELQQIEYFGCSRQSHENQPLSSVCADPQCNQRSLLCIYCQEQDHCQHKTVPLKQYLMKMLTSSYQQLVMHTSQVINKKSSNNKKTTNQEPLQTQEANNNDSQQKYTQENKSILTYSSQADKFRKVFHIEIEQFRTNINELLDEIKNCGSLYIHQLNTKIKEISAITKQVEYIIHDNKSFHQQDNISKSTEEIYTRKQISRIQGILKYGIIDENQQIPILEQLQNIIQDCQNRQIQLKKQLQSSLLNFKDISYKNLTSILNSDIITYSAIPSLVWSTKLKGDPMKITGNQLQRIPHSNSNQRFALLDFSLHRFMSQRKCMQWTFKINKLCGWIGLGICLKNKIQSGSFNFSYQALGHGSYMLSSNGYSWSSTVQSFNSAHHSISFTSGDFVTVQFDPANSKLNFQIKGALDYISSKKKKKCKHKTKPKSKTFSMQIATNIGLDQYYPCANLCSTGDALEIVND